MSSILLMILIIISLAAIFNSSAFQSGIKKSTLLKHLLTLNLSDFKQFSLLKSDKFLGIIKISRNTFILKPPFPQR